MAGRPVLVDMTKTGPLGTGDFYSPRALRLEDRDGDGLLDVHVYTGTEQVWVGYSQAAGSFVQKG